MKYLLSCKHIYPEPKCAVCICYVERERRLRLTNSNKIYPDRQVGMSAALGMPYGQEKSRMLRPGLPHVYYYAALGLDEKIIDKLKNKQGVSGTPLKPNICPRHLHELGPELWCPDCWSEEEHNSYWACRDGTGKYAPKDRPKPLLNSNFQMKAACVVVIIIICAFARYL